MRIRVRAKVRVRARVRVRVRVSLGGGSLAFHLANPNPNPNPNPNLGVPLGDELSEERARLLRRYLVQERPARLGQPPGVITTKRAAHTVDARGPWRQAALRLR